MPKIPRKRKPFEEIRFLLNGRFSVDELASLLGCSRPTIRKRLSSPETFTLDELARISRNGDVPWDEVKEAMKRR